MPDAVGSARTLRVMSLSRRGGRGRGGLDGVMMPKWKGERSSGMNEAVGRS